MTLREKIPFKADFSKDAKSLITHLCDHDLSKRFGNLVNGSGDIRSHRFFKTIDFNRIKSLEAVPPHVPKQNAMALRSLFEEKGLHTSMIPENRNDRDAPVIVKSKDIFSEWFWK